MKWKLTMWTILYRRLNYFVCSKSVCSYTFADLVILIYYSEWISHYVLYYFIRFFLSSMLSAWHSIYSYTMSWFVYVWLDCLKCTAQMFQWDWIVLLHHEMIGAWNLYWKILTQWFNGWKLIAVIKILNPISDGVESVNCVWRSIPRLFNQMSNAPKLSMVLQLRSICGEYSLYMCLVKWEEKIHFIL